MLESTFSYFIDWTIQTDLISQEYLYHDCYSWVQFLVMLPAPFTSRTDAKLPSIMYVYYINVINFMYVYV